MFDIVDNEKSEYFHENVYQELKTYYRDEIRRHALTHGYRELSTVLGHADSFITVVLRRDAFGALRRLYLEIMEFIANETV